MGNPLATEKIGKLMARFCIPAVIGMVVSALYNFVDQIFIGHGVGIFGNAATNVEFPINTVAMAMSLLVGIGTATFYNLSAGKGEKEKGVRAIGNGMSVVVIIGLIIMAAVLIFLKPVRVINMVFIFFSPRTWFMLGNLLTSQSAFLSTFPGRTGGTARSY